MELCIEVLYAWEFLLRFKNLAISTGQGPCQPDSRSAGGKIP